MKRINGKVIGDLVATPMPIPDWLQEDEKKADFIKNKPFGISLIGVEADLSSFTPSTTDYVQIPLDEAIWENLLDYEEELIPVTIEINHNGNVYGKDVSIHRSGGIYVDIDFDGGNILFEKFDDSCLYIMADAESFDGVTVRIYRETLKKIDRIFLPPNDVPYIYSEDGSVRLHDLDTGVYVLHGIFELGEPGEGYYFEDSFTYNPTLCQLINTKEEMFIKLSWVDSNIDDGLVGRYVEVYGSEVGTSEYFSLMDLFSVADEALSVAYEATYMAEDANGAVADAYAMAEEALSASDTGVAAHSTITEFINGDLPLPAIALYDENGDKWWLMVDSSGKVNTVKD